MTTSSAPVSQTEMIRVARTLREMMNPKIVGIGHEIARLNEEADNIENAPSLGLAVYAARMRDVIAAVRSLLEYTEAYGRDITAANHVWR